MNRESTPVWVRFSDATGLPLVPDNNPNASPRGCAIRFQLAERVHTDIIAHSANGFPTRTGQEFLEFFRALAASDPTKLAGIATRGIPGQPPQGARIRADSRSPLRPASRGNRSSASQRCVSPTRTGQSRYGRYRIVPEAGVDHLSDAAAAAKSANFLFDELAERIAKGPITFRVVAQLANDGDKVNDATEQWPEDRTLLDLGTIALTELVADNAHEQQWTIFDPIPRVDGIDASDDPLLELRAAIYLISGRRRRSAGVATSA